MPPDDQPGPAGEGPEVTDPAAEIQDELAFSWPELDNLRDALYACIVKKVGDRRYWETWANDIASIAEASIRRPCAVAAQHFSGFGTSSPLHRQVHGRPGRLDQPGYAAAAITRVWEHEEPKVAAVRIRDTVKVRH